MSMRTAFLLLFIPGFLFSQDFDLIPLGVYGGGDESNLSSYLISEKGKNEFLALDAGTLRAGIIKSIDHNIFKSSDETVLRENIKGYFISHGHLDHLAGLIINSPDDTSKNIYALSSTIEVMIKRYFTNDAWINFADEGDLPQLKKYHYQRKDKEEIFNIINTSLSGQIFKLSHVSPQLSSAILIKNLQGNAILYLGDTGADRVEGNNNLQHLWQSISTLIKKDQLKALLIEVSFDNDRPERLLFGHLTPALLNEELMKLAKISGKENLSGLKVVVTHLKPGENRIEKIKKQLDEANPAKVEFIFPKQGEKLEF